MNNNSSIKEALIEYRDLGLKIITNVKNGQYDYLNDLFSKRQFCIDQIKLINNNSEELKRLVNELEVLKLDREIKGLINSKHNDLMRKLGKLKYGTDAAVTYRKGNSAYVSKVLNMKL